MVYESWRDLLERLTRSPQERQQAAERVGVNTITLQRWVRGESQPRIHNILALPDAFPDHRDEFIELLSREFQLILPDPLSHSQGDHQPPTPEIPSEYLLKTLAEYARVNGPFTSWSQRNMALQQLRILLRDEGINVSLIRCVPPKQQGLPIRSLCEIMGDWQGRVERRLLFLGAESLAGWVVGKGEPGVIHNLGRPGLLPFRSNPSEKSAAAFPIQRKGNIAGCLQAVSCQKNWSTWQLSCLEAYAYALALSFDDEEFYNIISIDLQEIPSDPEREQALRLTFQERVLDLRKKHSQRLTIAQAELMVLQQLETEILQEKEQKA